MDDAFPPTRPARSAAYIAGARAVLQFLLREAALQCPYQDGTTSFDAFYAGVAEGREIWGRQMQAANPASSRAPSNSADLLAAELLAAEQIILAMLNAMTTAQKFKVGAQLERQGVIDGGGTTRYHERRAALVKAGFALPEVAGRPLDQRRAPAPHAHLVPHLPPSPLIGLWLRHARPYVPDTASLVVLFHLAFNLAVGLVCIGLTRPVSKLVQRILPTADAQAPSAGSRPQHLDPSRRLYRSQILFSTSLDSTKVKLGAEVVGVLVE
eukprot:gene33652-41518_t